MKIVQQSSDVITGLSPMEHIEKVGRICYKSEDKICDGSAGKFVNMLYGNNHMAMLEHYRFIMQVNPVIYDTLFRLNLTHFGFTKDNRYVISFNARALTEMLEQMKQKDVTNFDAIGAKSIQDELINQIVKAYDCYELFGIKRGTPLMVSTPVEFIPNSKLCMTQEEWEIHGWKSIHFVTDRGISHEIVRHREETSFAQESTRYCNYGNKGGEITVVDQGFKDYEYECWKNTCELAECRYLSLLSMSITPQFARSILPTCLKTEIVVTAPVYEWKHIINLRVLGTTGKPHPMIKQLMTPIAGEFITSEELEAGGNNE